MADLHAYVVCCSCMISAVPDCVPGVKLMDVQDVTTAISLYEAGCEFITLHNLI